MEYVKTLDFGELLKRKRMDRKISLRQLGELAKIKHPNLSAAEHGRRTVGPGQAIRLADALRLSPEERQEFLAAAAATGAAGLLQAKLDEYPDQVRMAIARILMKNGIFPHHIMSFLGSDTAKDGETDYFLMNNGKEIQITVTVTIK